MRQHISYIRDNIEPASQLIVFSQSPWKLQYCHRGHHRQYQRSAASKENVTKDAGSRLMIGPGRYGTVEYLYCNIISIEIDGEVVTQLSVTSRDR